MNVSRTVDRTVPRLDASHKKRRRPWVERVVPSFRRVLGDENVVPVEPSMGGEDFSQYGLAGVPIFMFRVGSVTPERFAEMKKEGKMPPSLHSPFYYPDARESIVTGVTAMAAAVVDLMKAK